MAARRRARRRDGAGAEHARGHRPAAGTHVLTGSAGATTTAASAAAASSGGDDPGPVREDFLGWYEARHDDVPRDAAEAV